MIIPKTFLFVNPIKFNLSITYYCKNSNYNPGKVFELNKKFKLEDSYVEKNVGI